MTVKKSLTAVVLITAGLGACGGDISLSFNAPPRPPAAPSEGLWQGSTSTARTITAFVLDNSVYWILYSSLNPGAGIAGLACADAAHGNAMLHAATNTANFIRSNCSTKGGRCHIFPPCRSTRNYSRFSPAPTVRHR